MEPLTPGQHKVLKFIRRFKERRGYAPTLDEIARHFRIIKPTVQQYLRALEQKSIIRRKRYGHRSIEIVAERFGGGRPQLLPLVGRIAAGAPVEAIEATEMVDVGDVLSLNDDRELFLLQVKGESMIEDGIFDGDYVVAERSETARNGDTVVALLPDGTATLKRFYRESTRIRLQPANPHLKPVYVTDVVIQGVVRGVIRSLKRS
ncbi:MAG: transcriptional repressor LexA [Phycisphaerae bacterium]|jgi:repressor LexA|nr:transcriptional repressor LexA [Phycisphaerae bacterium]